jgi:hypothetical protein
LVAAAALAVVAGLAWATPGAGTSSTLNGRATFAEEVKLRRVSEDHDWSIKIQAKPSLDVAVQTITFDPGGYSGWHSHPGPVFISVVEGTMTFYEGNDPECNPIVRTAGQGYLDTGDHPHIARNETGLPAKNVVTYFAPQGAALRIDEPNPGNCSF